MKAFHPLSDCTLQNHNLQNVQALSHGSRLKPTTSSVLCVPPSYAATIGRTTAPATALPKQPLFTHNPYAAVVLREPMYLASSSLDVSRDSVCSSQASGASISPSTPIATLSPTVVTVKAPIRRVYRNGRPVPVFSDPSAAVAPVSM
eukprot:CAMPEP_0176447622 /NCGR_PEP_ID=MMETSP0127-20121128/25174_1 /TAXON_ID=938130 /ORGANISM="Platyophrya macrostoma, Strain WH" /LENGTH=146 /DNA_ID=CAMNT_0017834169 /DNA_START=182 /DNA_END=622 /DNA_ORIENTATION=+